MNVSGIKHPKHKDSGKIVAKLKDTKDNVQNIFNEATQAEVNKLMQKKSAVKTEVERPDSNFFETDNAFRINKEVCFEETNNNALNMLFNLDQAFFKRNYHFLMVAWNGVMVLTFLFKHFSFFRFVLSIVFISLIYSSNFCYQNSIVKGKNSAQYYTAFKLALAVIVPLQYFSHLDNFEKEGIYFTTGYFRIFLLNMLYMLGVKQAFIGFALNFGVILLAGDPEFNLFYRLYCNIFSYVFLTNIVMLVFYCIMYYSLALFQRQVWVLYESFKINYWALKDGLESISHPVFVINLAKIDKMEVALSNKAAKDFVNFREIQSKKSSQKVLKKMNSVNFGGSVSIRSIVPESRLDEFLIKLVKAVKSGKSFYFPFYKNSLELEGIVKEQFYPAMFKGHWYKVIASKLCFRGTDSVMIQLIDSMEQNNLSQECKLNVACQSNLDCLVDNCALIARKLSQLKNKSESQLNAPSILYTCKNDSVICKFDYASIYALKHEVYLVYSWFNNIRMLKSIMNNCLDYEKCKVSLDHLLVNVVDSLFQVMNKKKATPVSKISIKDDFIVNYGFLRGILFNLMAYFLQNMDEKQEKKINIEVNQHQFQAKSQNIYLISFKSEKKNFQSELINLKKLEEFNFYQSYNMFDCWAERNDFKLNLAYFLIKHYKQFIGLNKSSNEEEGNSINISEKDGMVCIDILISLVSADNSTQRINSESTVYMGRTEYSYEVRLDKLSAPKSDFYNKQVASRYLTKVALDSSYKRESTYFHPSRQVSKIRTMRNKDSFYEKGEFSSSGDERENPFLEEDKDLFNQKRTELLKMGRSQEVLLNSRSHNEVLKNVIILATKRKRLVRKGAKKLLTKQITAKSPSISASQKILLVSSNQTFIIQVQKALKKINYDYEVIRVDSMFKGRKVISTLNKLKLLYNKHNSESGNI